MTTARWHRCLLVLCWVFAAQGLMWVVLGSFDPWGIWDGLAADTFFGGRTPAEVTRFQAFILAPFGATDAAYFVLLASLVRHALPRGEAWAWRAAAGSLALWFAVDTTASLAHGAAFNVWVVNVPALAVLGVPLLAVRPRSESSVAKSLDPR